MKKKKKTFHTSLFLEFLFSGEIQKKGIVVPFTSDIYSPILKRLKLEGISATESEIIH